jgi:large subunit ribosomal protein L3
MKGILGRKVGMTQIYDETGEVIPVTVIEAGPCHVLQIRTSERDGYEAVQLGFIDKPRRLARRSERGHVAKLSSKRSKTISASGVDLLPKPDCEPKRFVRELRGPTNGHELGQDVTVEMFQPSLVDLPQMLKEAASKNGIDIEKPGWKREFEKKKAIKFREAIGAVMSVDVVAISKGRGFAGVMKRHNFHGQRATHGVKKVHRHAGGTGCSASPSRLFKGRRMAGHYGNVQVTVRNLSVARVDVDDNILLVRGAVPGPNGGYVIVRETNMV